MIWAANLKRVLKLNRKKIKKNIFYLTCKYGVYKLFFS